MRAWVVRPPGPIDGGPLALVERAEPQPARARSGCGCRCAGCAGPTSTWPRATSPPRRADVDPATRSSAWSTGSAPGVDRFARASGSGIAWLRHTCGACRFCRWGDENLCVAPRFTGWDADGGYAEYAVVDERYAYAPARRLLRRARPRRCCAPASSATAPCGGRPCPRRPARHLRLRRVGPPGRSGGHGRGRHGARA